MPYCRATTAKLDTKKQDPKSRRYQRGTVAVLPLMAIGGTTALDSGTTAWGDKRYCRSGRGTTAGRKTELPKLLHMSSELSKLKLVG